MIAEVGNHESLMENKKYYYELIQSQYELDTGIIKESETTKATVES